MSMFSRETMDRFAADALPETDAATVEKASRDSPVAQALVREALARVDPGVHSIGGVWRRERVSCPTRDQLGGYVLNAGDADLRAYIAFHLTTVGCDLCRANVDDLRPRPDAAGPAADARRRLIFASSAGLVAGPKGRA